MSNARRSDAVRDEQCAAVGLVSVSHTCDDNAKVIIGVIVGAVCLGLGNWNWTPPPMSALFNLNRTGLRNLNSFPGGGGARARVSLCGSAVH